MALAYTLSFFFVLFVGIASQCNRNRTHVNQGTRLCCYHSELSIPAIGSGFNLRRSDAAKVLSSYNLNLKDVLNDCKHSTRKACLTYAQAADMFNKILYPPASVCASSYASGMPAGVHAALADIAYSSCAILNQFVKMKAALIKKDWRSASNNLKTSRWCQQVRPIRCNLIAGCLILGT